jgi:dihydrofolate reductase
MEDIMAKLRVHGFTMSLDGYGAGPSQSLAAPLGVGGEQLHRWLTATRSWQEVHGIDGEPDAGGDGEAGGAGIDDQFAAEGDAGIGATIMGRNMFGPIRGPWTDGEWRGWWGDNPPFHHDVFVLTHHARDPIAMAGGTTFHFVTDGIEAALERAVAAAGGADVRLGGGASTIQQYLRAGLVDDMHIAITPVLLGSGERLFDKLDGGPEGYECTEFVCSPAAMHIRLTRARG